MESHQIDSTQPALNRYRYLKSEAFQMRFSSDFDPNQLLTKNQEPITNKKKINKKRKLVAPVGAVFFVDQSTGKDYTASHAVNESTHIFRQGVRHG